MEQYLALTRGNHAPGVVKPEIGGNMNFKINSQFMQELREDTFFENKNDDAHEHVEPLSKGIAHRSKPLSNLKKSKTSSKKVTKHYTKLGNGSDFGHDTCSSVNGNPNYADHSQKWHDGSSSRNVDNSSNADGITAIVNKLENLDRDMKKLKENIHVIQVECQNCRGAHVDKDRPLSEEVKKASKRLNMESLDLPSLSVIDLKESSRKRAEMEEWLKKLKDNAEINTRNPSASLKSLETQIEQLTKEFDTKTTSEVNSLPDQCKSVYTNKEAPLNNASPKVSYVCTKYSQNERTSSRIMPCQLPPKELNPGNFTLPCTIGSLNFYAMEDLGASVNVIPKSMFEHLKLVGLTKTDMLVEMADTTKRTPI
ncbi:reverse transcriptase domain-containing protein [Tanacetum coccineum]